MAGRLDLIIEKGSTFTRVFTWQTRDQETGALIPVDLSGYTARSMFRETHDSPQAFFDLSTENGGIFIDSFAGKITLKIEATQSTNVIYDSGVWDLELYQGTNVTRLIEGRVKLTPEVTR